MNKIIFGFVAALSLVACATRPVVAPAGDYTPDAKFSVNLKQDWSYYSPRINFLTKGGLLTMDGPVLNSVYLMTLKPGSSLIETASAAEDAPIYTADQSAIAQVEFLTASLSKMGYEAVETTRVEPVSVDNHDGIMVGIASKTATGLEIKGDVIMVETDEGLNVILFLAPALHYYDAVSEDVHAMMTSMKLSAS